MATKVLSFQQFEGGQGTDLKVGTKNSFAYSQALDFRKSPSQMSVLPGPTKEASLSDLLVNEVMASDGTIYGFGNSGYFYKRTTGGTWSTENKLGSSAFGMDYRVDTDAIYLAHTKTVSLYNPVSSSPSMYADYYGISQSTYNNTTTNGGLNLNANQSGSTLTTTLATTFAETSTKLRYFQSDIEPLNKVSVYIPASGRGTGDWTLTLHDGLNNVLATSTVTTANLVNAAWNDFVFSGATNGQVRLYVSPNARTYHLHLTSTVADGTVSSSTTNDLSTCDLQVWADRLIQTNNGLHPMARFQQYECIGNGNYLSAWEPLTQVPTNSEWLRHKLVFPSDYEVCGLAVLNEFIAIACERTKNATQQSGIIFWWDGLSPTYNYYTVIPEGAPYALKEYLNTVYYFAHNALYAIAGANSVPVKVQTMPGADSEFSGAAAPITIYPYATTTRRGVHLLAYPSTTTNTSISYGVYSWGSVDKNFPQAFGYNYLISTGAQNYSVSNNLTIGMVRNFQDTLHISWRDDLNGGYGVDVVNNSTNPASFADWQSLLIDSGIATKKKTANYIACYYSLPSGASIKLKYKLDREANWHYSDAYTSTSLWEGRAGFARLGVGGTNGGRFYEAQIGFEITSDSTVTTPPTVYSLAFTYDDGREELFV